MKLFAESKASTMVFVEMTKDEWDFLQSACGIPYDKRREVTSMDARIVRETVETLQTLKTFRKDLGSLQKRWDKLASAIDGVISPEKDRK